MKTLWDRCLQVKQDLEADPSRATSSDHLVQVARAFVDWLETWSGTGNDVVREKLVNAWDGRPESEWPQPLRDWLNLEGD